MLRGQIMTSSESHAAFQELTICEDVDTKFHNAHFTTPDAIIEYDIKNTNAKL